MSYHGKRGDDTAPKQACSCLSKCEHRTSSAAHRDRSREWGRFKANVEPLLTSENSGNHLQVRGVGASVSPKTLPKPSRHPPTTLPPHPPCTLLQVWATLGEAARRAREMGDKKDETMLEGDEGTLKALAQHSGALSPEVTSSSYLTECNN